MLGFLSILPWREKPSESKKCHRFASIHAQLTSGFGLPSGHRGDWGPSMRAVFSSHPGRQNWSWVCTIQNIFNVHAWHIVLTSLCPSCDISGSWISLYKAFLSLKHKQLITVCVSFLTCLSQDFENWSACLWYSSLLDTCVFSSLLIWHLMNFCELSALEELQQFRNLTRLALIWRQKTNKEFMKSH